MAAFIKLTTNNPQGITYNRQTKTGSKKTKGSCPQRKVHKRGILSLAKTCAVTDLLELATAPWALCC